MGGMVDDSGRFDWSQNDKFPSLSQPEPAYHGLRFHETFGDLAMTVHGHAVGLRDLGATMAPINAFLTITGIETLPLRMERHVRNAQAVAQFLEAHPKTAWVSYAGLRSSPHHGLARKYLPQGAGSVFTFGLRGGYEAGIRMVRSEEHTSELQSLMRLSYAVFCLKKKQTIKSNRCKDCSNEDKPPTRQFLHHDYYGRHE